MIAQYAQWWDAAKLGLQLALHLGRDGPHAHVGIFIMVIILIMSRGRWPRFAWAIALLAELVNEAIDLSWAGPESSLASSGHDLIVTMIPPTILFIALKLLSTRSSATQTQIDLTKAER